MQATGVIALLLLSALAVLSPSASAGRPPNKCALTPTFSSGSYSTGSILSLAATNTCGAIVNLQLRWPDGTNVQVWPVGAGSTTTVTYQIPPYAPTGTWSAVPAKGPTATTQVSAYANPLPVRLRVLSEAEAVLAGCNSQSCGSASGSYAVKDFPWDPPHDSGSVDWTSFGQTLSRVSMGDVDGDGSEEIVAIADWGDSTPQVQVVDRGNPLLSLVWAFPSGEIPVDVAVGDFNGDGRGEIAVLYQSTDTSDHNSYVDVWTASGVRLSSTGAYYLVLPPTDYIRRIAAGDLNDDSRDELLMTNDQTVDHQNSQFIVRYWNFTTQRGDSRTFSGTNRVTDLTYIQYFGAATGRIGVLDSGKLKVLNVDNTDNWKDTDYPNWVSVTDGASGYDIYAVAAGDFNTDGMDEIFTLAMSRTVNARVYKYDLRSPGNYPYLDAGRIMWESGIAGDAGSMTADIAAGDWDGDGLMLTPTGDVRTTTTDSALIARVVVPPYVQGTSTVATGFFGQKTTHETDTGYSTSWRAGGGVSVAFDLGLAQGEVTVVAGASHLDSVGFGTTASVEYVQESQATKDTLILTKTSFKVYKYQAWQDINGDHKTDASDTLWLVSPYQYIITGVAVADWNSGGEAVWGKSWIALPNLRTPGDPTTYLRGCPDDSTVFWVARNSLGACDWTEVTSASLDKNYGHGESITISHSDTTFVEADGAVRFGTDLFNVGPAVTFGFETTKLQQVTTTTDMTIGVDSPNLPYYPHPYEFNFVPVLKKVSMASPNDPNVKQNFYVMDYNVDLIGSAYPRFTASALISSTEGVVPWTVSFVGIPSDGVPPYAYHWDFGDGTSADQFDPTHVYQTPGDYQAVLTISDSVGQQATFSQLMKAHPPLSVTPTADKTSGYVPLSVNFNAAAQGGIPPYTYSWTFGDGGTSAVQAPSHTYATSGTYTAQVTVSDSAASQGFPTNVASGSLTITAGAPVLTAEAMISSREGVVPWTVTFFGIPNGGTSPYAYHWDFGDGSSANQYDPTHVYTVAGDYQAVLTITDSSQPQQQATHAYAMTAHPALTATGSSDKTSGRAPLLVSFTAAGHGGIPPYTYYWTFGDGGTSTVQNPSHTYTAGGTYLAQVSVSDSAAGLGFPTNVASWSVTISVSPPMYTLSIWLSTGGTTDPRDGDYQHESGTVVQVQANPGAGYEFDHWDLDNTPVTTNPILVTMDSNHDLVPNFRTAPGYYTLTISAGIGGTTDPSPGSHSYTPGTVVTVNASETDPCYFFWRWTLDGSNVYSNPIDVTMGASHTLSAAFKKDRFCEYGPAGTAQANPAAPANPSVGTSGIASDAAALVDWPTLRWIGVAALDQRSPRVILSAETLAATGSPWRWLS